MAGGHIAAIALSRRAGAGANDLKLAVGKQTLGLQEITASAGTLGAELELQVVGGEERRRNARKARALATRPAAAAVHGLAPST